MKKTFTQEPVIPEGYTGNLKDYNRWIKYVNKQVSRLTNTSPDERLYSLVQTTGFILLILTGFCLQACRVNPKLSEYPKDHDTGTYYRYRAINLRTGRVELAKVDTVWDVYQPTDTVYLDAQGFIAQTKAKIADTVRLGICVGTVTLVDDTLILSATHILPKGNYANIYLDVPPPPIKK